MVVKMSREDIEKWDELYQYIKKEVFKYDKSQKLPTYMAIRLKGLKEGKFAVNNKTKPMANYDYSHILYTFKINKIKIEKIVKSSNFNNEQHKFNAIMVLIEREINDVVNRLKQAAKSEDKVKNMEFENVTYEGADYKNKNKERDLNDELKELW